MKTKHLKPKGGVKVRKPAGTYLKDDGEDLPLSSYWLRRIAEGDLEVTDVVTVPATKSTKAEK
ncbi:uncharacterized protein DUF2635|uniref:Uncharacterized protein DUF2635 n=1 Tax=Brenneria salicis ATCC 15712 = DSM 30166 TaxID=714314 RepID=A0A366I9R1_9GAMM|nr:DUF2635 domain-containing protein [Brenneria salicis]NMN90530.1 uncharacterized protein DUF2635 [Brenneria salicis ATCC 15712 = DSM 30166]RBP64860.1 uncharacterized protein DUF2635 [Brenneria salicis ATCC 15712 = DSM 30166]RLM31579.1 hypothetical protein BHG07_04795 [Brenneria salicis ATCC 15712 = DSM 30166]